MLCEICGEREAVTRIEVDGVVLKVCWKCAKFGREITEKKVERGTKKQVRDRAEEDVLPDYANRIRKAREEKGISRKELATMINEKLSVIEKIEAGKMIPEEKLAKKLEKALGIKIMGAVDYGESSAKDVPPATLGDIAEVRVKRG